MRLKGFGWVTLRVAIVYICWAWVFVKCFSSCCRMSCPILFSVWVAPYSFTVGVVMFVVLLLFLCFGGMRPCCVMRPRYCLVIFLARFLFLSQVEVTA